MVQFNKTIVKSIDLQNCSEKSFETLNIMDTDDADASNHVAEVGFIKSSRIPTNPDPVQNAYNKKKSNFFRTS